MHVQAEQRLWCCCMPELPDPQLGLCRSPRAPGAAELLGPGSWATHTPPALPQHKAIYVFEIKQVEHCICICWNAGETGRRLLSLSSYPQSSPVSLWGVLLHRQTCLSPGEKRDGSTGHLATLPQASNPTLPSPDQSVARADSWVHRET